jgi:hypothetical protein
MYYVMHKDFTADYLKDAVSYGDLRLSGTKPLDFNGEVVDVCVIDLKNDELVSLFESMNSENIVSKLSLLNTHQGRVLYDIYVPLNNDGLS